MKYDKLQFTYYPPGQETRSGFNLSKQKCSIQHTIIFVSYWWLTLYKIN